MGLPESPAWNLLRFRMYRLMYPHTSGSLQASLLHVFFYLPFLSGRRRALYYVYVQKTAFSSFAMRATDFGPRTWPPRWQRMSYLSSLLVLMASPSIARAPLSSELTCVKATVGQVFLWARCPNLAFPLITREPPSSDPGQAEGQPAPWGPRGVRSAAAEPSCSPPRW